MWWTWARLLGEKVEKEHTCLHAIELDILALPLVVLGLDGGDVAARLFILTEWPVSVCSITTRRVPPGAEDQRLFPEGKTNLALVC